MARGKVTVKFNHFPAVIAALPRELASGLDSFVNELETELKARVWRRYGVIADTVQDRDPRKLNATVSVGLHLKRGFYSRFNEWGTVKQAARPVVGPVAHESEPKLVDTMTTHIRRACNAK